MDSVHVSHKNNIRSPKPLGVCEQVVIKGAYYIDEKIRSVFDKDIGEEANIIGWEVSQHFLVIYNVQIKGSGDIKAYFPEDLIFIGRL